MAKVIPSALQAHYDTGQTCLSAAILIQRNDGEVFGFVMNSQPLTLDLSLWNSPPWDLAGLTAFEFDAAHGMEALSIQSSVGLDVDDATLVVLNKGEVFTELDILAGRWRGAKYRLFLYRWDVANPHIEADIETLKVGTIGEIHVTPVTLQIELHCLKRRLQLPVGMVSQPTCRARFGDSLCRVDLAPFTHTFAVSTVSNATTFTSSDASGFAADAFAQGSVTLQDGPNAGLPLTVESSDAFGGFVLSAPTVFPIVPGDTLIAVEGCRKRLLEDCRDRYANVVNFQGEPHRPTRDKIISGTGE